MTYCELAIALSSSSTNVCFVCSEVASSKAFKLSWFFMHGSAPAARSVLTMSVRFNWKTFPIQVLRFPILPIFIKNCRKAYILANFIPGVQTEVVFREITYSVHQLSVMLKNTPSSLHHIQTINFINMPYKKLHIKLIY